MNSSPYTRITLDPNDLPGTTQQLVTIFDLSIDESATISRIVELYPRRTQMYLDAAQAELHRDNPLADKFTFDVETDDLVLFASDAATLIDATIEMAMYLSGFTTKIGNDDLWVIEFTIGAWKPVKRNIKQQLGITVADHPTGLVGLRPDPREATEGDPYPFRTLVSYFDQLSFQQMIMLAAREDVKVYFPAGTHPKVRAVYMHARRAIEEVGQFITLQDHQIFNLKLNNAIHRIEQLFDPGNLEPPNWVSRLVNNETSTASKLPQDSEPYDPFEAFIEQLFSDEEDNNELLHS